MARFAISNNALFTVSFYDINIYDITNPRQFVLKKTLAPGIGNLETIFMFQNKLFIGSQTGMYIYDISNEFNPVLIGTAQHLRTCDPVVANTRNAFVTLRSGVRCGTATDGLYIYDITGSVTNPVLVKTLPMPTPYGLGLNGNILYVCQGANGLKVLDVSNPATPREIRQIPGNTSNRDFRDVIVQDNLLIAYTATGIALFDITLPTDPQPVKDIRN